MPRADTSFAYPNFPMSGGKHDGNVELVPAEVLLDVDCTVCEAVILDVAPVTVVRTDFTGVVRITVGRADGIEERGTGGTCAGVGAGAGVGFGREGTTDFGAARPMVGVGGGFGVDKAVARGFGRVCGAMST